MDEWTVYRLEGSSIKDLADMKIQTKEKKVA